MDKEQESKYGISDDCKIYNRASGEVIPPDEPIMIFRAKDKNTALMISYYKTLCSNEKHKEKVNERLHQFVDWQHKNPEKLAEPDTAEYVAPKRPKLTEEQQDLFYMLDNKTTL